MTEQFRVHPPALVGYSGQVDRNVGYVQQMRAYIADHGSKTDEMEGLLSGLVSGYKPVLEWQLGILQAMLDKLPKTAEGLRQTAGAYEKTDKKKAADLDKSYKPGV
jgi:hypothetical protein